VKPTDLAPAGAAASGADVPGSKDALSGVILFPGPSIDAPSYETPTNEAPTDEVVEPGAIGQETTGPQRKPFLYRSLFDWYTAWLAKTIERRLDATGTGTLTWCPRWWAHPEVNARLEALWRAWEVARHQDGDAPARWFGQLDQNLKILMDAKLGPMADCGPDTHRRYANTRPLPGEPAPPGWWGTSSSDENA
jgi:hypothetical protein